MKINNVNSVQSTTFKAKMSLNDIKDARAFISQTSRTLQERDSANIILNKALEMFSRVGDKNTRIKYFPPRYKDQIGYYRLSNDLFSDVSIPLSGLPKDKYYREDIYLFNGPQKIFNDLEMIMDHNLIQKAEKRLLEKVSRLRHIHPKRLLQDMQHKMTNVQFEHWRGVAKELNSETRQLKNVSRLESFEDYFKREYAKMNKK